MVGQRRKFLNFEGLKVLFLDPFQFNLKRICGRITENFQNSFSWQKSEGAMGVMLKARRRKKMCAAGATSVNYFSGKVFLPLCFTKTNLVIP